MTVTETILDELANFVASGGDPRNSRVRGDGFFIVCGAGNTVSFTPDGPRRITAVRMNGTNMCVSRNGLTFNTVNSGASGFQAHMIAFLSNSSAENHDTTRCNVVIVPPQQIWINNGGAGVGTVLFYWDILDGQLFPV